VENGANDISFCLLRSAISSAGPILGGAISGTGPISGGISDAGPILSW